jgi:hypothetical protein
MKHILAILLFGVTSLALAGSCPAEMKVIDAKLQAPGLSLSADQLSKVQSLRADGERLHKEGKHGESMKSLGEAKKILGM